MHPPTPQDIDFALTVIGADQAIADAEGLTQLQSPRLLGQQRVRSRLDDEARNGEDRAKANP